MRSALAAAAAFAAILTACGTERTPEETVRAWTDAVGRGDDEEAAALFADGAVVVQGGVPLVLATRADARRWVEQLPCAAEITALEQDAGGELTVTFRLADRGATACDGPGAEVVVDLVVRGGHIERFEQRGVPAGVAALE